MLDYKNPDLRIKGDFESKEIGWQSPSNIAIIKYWGKYGIQLPRNASISFTLSAAHTKTEVTYAPKITDQPIEIDFYFEGKQNASFSNKIERFLSSITEIFPFLEQLRLVIHSSNSFPHSAGIASSASAMSALALCLCSIEQELFGTLKERTPFLQKASYVARLGSGSACRSVYPTMAAWGETDHLDKSSNLYAIGCQDEIHDVFKNYHDDILFISKKEKSVSSRAGHALMDGNPYANPRYQQANERFGILMQALRSGDVTTFGDIAEQEALTLHALMMTSYPAYILMTPTSLDAINRVQAFRKSSGVPLYFSLDAGPNLHLLYPDSVTANAKEFIKNELASLCVDGDYLDDVVGEGAARYL